MKRDYDRIRAFLAGVRRLDRWARLSASLLRLGVVCAAVLSLDILLVERIPDSPWAGFAVALAGTVSFWAALAGVALAARGMSLRRAARRVEILNAEFRDDIVTGLSLAPSPESTPPEAACSRPLLRALVATTGDRLAGMRPGAFVSWDPARKWSLRLALTALPLAALSLAGLSVSGASLRAVADPTVYWPPGKVAFTVTPGAARVPRGGDLDIRAEVRGPTPGTVILVTETGGSEVRTLMERQGGSTFGHVLRDLRFSLRYRLSSAAASSPWYDVEIVDAPTAGNFGITYTWPAYTGLPPLRAEGSGDLEAFKGSGVRVEFSTNKPLRRGSLFLGGSQYEVERVAPGRYGASFYLNGEESYRLELVDEEGFGNTDALEYAVRYLPDSAPEVRILLPEGEVTLGPFVQIPIRFQTADDFGISRVSLLTRDPAGREVREPVLSRASGQASEREYLWDAAGIEAAPGSLVPVFLEAVDNDTISGPKASLSNSFLLRIPDVEEEHRKTGKALDELLDEMVDLLADGIDLLGRYEGQEERARERWDLFSWDDFAGSEELRRSVERGAAEAAGDLDALQFQMSTDPSARAETLYQLGLVDRKLDETRKMTLSPMGDVAASVDPAEALQEEFLEKSGFMGQYAGEAVAALEQMVLQLEELQRERNMADVQRSGSDMMDLQEKILDGLEALNPDDGEAMEEILEALADMEELLHDLMEALSRENQELPEEFLNSDALQDLPLGQMMEGLRQIGEMLRSGDVEGAKQAAREMLKSMADLMNALQQAREEFQGRMGEALSRLKNSTVPALDRMIDEQQKVLKQTEEIEGGLREREDGSGTDDGRPPGADGLLTEGEKARTDYLGEKEGALQQEAAELAREASALKAVLPFLDDGIETDLQGASSGMGKAGERLGSGQPGAAVSPERYALGRLMSARDRARQSLQAMEQMQQMRNGRGPMPMLFGAGQGGRGMSQPRPGMQSGGGLGTDVRSFRIPGREDFQTPPLFRQEILKSLGEGYPEPYEEKIREYFHRITE